MFRLIIAEKPLKLMIIRQQRAGQGSLENTKQYQYIFKNYMQTYHIQAEKYQTEQILILGVGRGQDLKFRDTRLQLTDFFHQAVQSRREGSNI